jgi:hypothetical protein
MHPDLQRYFIDPRDLSKRHEKQMCEAVLFQEMQRKALEKAKAMKYVQMKDEVRACLASVIILECADPAHEQRNAYVAGGCRQAANLATGEQ